MKTIHIAILAIVSISTTLYAQSAFQREFQQLKAQHDKAVAVATQPINRNYQAALQQLLLRASQNKDMEAIGVIVAEMKAMEAKPDPGPSEPQMLTGKWSGDGNDLLIIRPDNTAQHGRDSATWEIRSGNLFLKWNNGWGHRIPLNQTGERIRAYGSSPTGKITDMHLTRVP